jgi:hypothetical protein
VKLSKIEIFLAGGLLKADVDLSGDILAGKCGSIT